MHHPTVVEHWLEREIAQWVWRLETVLDPVGKSGTG